MAELLTGAAMLLVLVAVAATAAEESRCRRLPRMYGGGVDIADFPPADDVAERLGWWIQ